LPTTATETAADTPTVVLTYLYADDGSQPSGLTCSIGGTLQPDGTVAGGTLDYQDSYTYNTDDQLIEIARSGQTGGDAVAAETITISYNAAGQFQTIDRYLGASTTGTPAVEGDYTYNAAGQLTQLTYSGSMAQQGAGATTLASYIYTYGTAASGQSADASTTGVTPDSSTSGGWLPGGATMPFTDPSQIDMSSLNQAVSAADQLASVTSKTDGTATYSYDAQGELLGATYGSPLPSGEGQGEGVQPNESYSYDANGNRLPAASDGKSSPQYTIGSDNEVTFDGTYSYAYDADGNRIERTDVATGTVTGYTWDNGNRLTAVKDYANSSAYQSGTCTEAFCYYYDAENRWIGQDTETFDASGNVLTDHETRFVYAGNQIVLQFDGNVSPLPSGEGQGEGGQGGDSSPLPPGEGQGEGVPLTISNLSHRYLWGPAVDQLMADEQLSPAAGGGYDLTTPGRAVWALADSQGTVRDLAVTDGSGMTTVVNHRVFSAYGELLSQTNPSTTPATLPTVGCLIGYTGQPLSVMSSDASTGAESGLQIAQRRIYDAAIAQWLSKDPTGLTAGDTNTRRYCGDSPTNATDPSGLGQVKFGLLTVTLTTQQQTVYDAAKSQLLKIYGAASVQYKLRLNIVLAALTSNLRYTPDGWRSPIFWSLAGGGGYWHVKQNVSPSLAVADAWIRPSRELWRQAHPNGQFPTMSSNGQSIPFRYSSGCKKDCELIFLMGISLTCSQLDIEAGRRIGGNPSMGPFPASTYLGRFDALIGSQVTSDLFDAEPSKLQIVKTCDPKGPGFALADLTPGDRVRVKNPTPRAGDSGDTGTNLIYAGDGVFVLYSGLVIPATSDDGGLGNLFKAVARSHNLSTTAGLKIATIYQPTFPF
jgi:RHS repeat-associated protein